jgi:hypothetical protein
MKRVALGVVLLLLSLPVTELIHARPDRNRDSRTSSGARHGGQARGDARLGLQAKPVATNEERGRPLTTGKEFFVEGCGKGPRRCGALPERKRYLPPQR